VDTLKCAYCGNGFEKITNCDKKYCSTACYKIAKWKRHSPKRVFKIYDRECVICGNKFRAKDYRSKYCSKECVSTSRRKFLDVPSCLEKASRKIDRNLGYVRVYAPMHREANSWGYVYEHRLIAEEMIGRSLNKDEVVHHKNGKRWDNRKENLEVMGKREHAKLSGQREEDL
jgi:hypothetical protein